MRLGSRVAPAVCCQYCCQAAGLGLSRADNPGTSVQHMTGYGRSWTMCPLLWIRRLGVRGSPSERSCQRPIPNWNRPLVVSYSIKVQQQDSASPVSWSHVGERDHEPGMGCGHPVVGRRGWHGGEVGHVEHGAPLGPFSDLHDLSSGLDLSLTPSAETIING